MSSRIHDRPINAVFVRRAVTPPAWNSGCGSTGRAEIVATDLYPSDELHVVLRVPLRHASDAAS